MTTLETAQGLTPMHGALDITTTLILFVIRVALLAGVLTLVSRRKACLSLKTCVLVAAVLSAAYFLLDVTPESLLSLRAFLFVALLGAVLSKRLFEIATEVAFVACLLFCCLSILMGSYTHRWLDRMIPGRPTIGGAIAAALDEQVRRNTGDGTLRASTGLMPALLRVSMTPGSNEIADALLAPMRTAQRAKAQIAEINRKASQQASIVNMLSGAGTNVGNRDAEVAALRDQLTAEAQGGSVPPAAGGEPPAGAPAAPAPAAAEPVPAPTVAEPAPAPLVAAPAPAPAVAMPAPVSIPASTATAAALSLPAPASAPAGAVPVAAAAGGGAGERRVKAGKVLCPPGMGAEERVLWERASEELRVSSVIRSAKQAAVMVQGRVVFVGSTCEISCEGRDYTFLLRSVDRTGACKWEAIVPEDEPNTSFIAF